MFEKRRLKQLSFDFTWEICHLLDITAVAGHLACLAVLFTIEAYIKVGRCSQLNKYMNLYDYQRSTWTYMNIKGQGHLLTLVQGHSNSTFSNFFFLETARTIEAKFYMEHPCYGRTKMCSNGPGYMINMAAMPIYDKNLKRGARWLSGRVSDSGARGRGFETYRRRVVSLSKALYSPKVLVNYPGSSGSVPTWLKNCWLGR